MKYEELPKGCIWANSMFTNSLDGFEETTTHTGRIAVVSSWVVIWIGLFGFFKLLSPCKTAKESADMLMNSAGGVFYIFLSLIPLAFIYLIIYKIIEAVAEGKTIAQYNIAFPSLLVLFLICTSVLFIRYGLDLLKKH